VAVNTAMRTYEWTHPNYNITLQTPDSLRECQIITEARDGVMVYCVSQHDQVKCIKHPTVMVTSLTTPLYTTHQITATFKRRKREFEVNENCNTHQNFKETPIAFTILDKVHEPASYHISSRNRLTLNN
jgi:hypothetical protein